MDEIETVAAALRRSKFRSRFALNRNDRDYIRRKGLDTIRGHAVDFMTERIAPARPANDGRQTPMRNHPVFVAQHATATCCRRCIEKWHRILRGIPLGDKEKEYIVNVIMSWIEREMNTTTREET